MKYKKQSLLAGFIVLCSVALSGCESEGKPLSKEMSGEDNQSEISAEKEPPVQTISEWPEPYEHIFVQYKSILKEADDLDVNSVMEKFYEGGEWEYVDIELYLAGRREGIWYSLCDLTNDGFPELILGVRNSGTGAKDQQKNGFYNPYAMYYYDKEKDVITYRSFGGFPTTFYEGGVDLSVGSGVTELMMFSQFQEDTMQWEGVAAVGLKWENGELIGYYKLDDDDQEIMISEEEYHHIITQYATTPIELDWHPLDFEQTGQDGNISSIEREAAEADLSLESEIHGDNAEDPWGLDAIMEVFDMWGWTPSNDPTSLKEIADRAGNTQEYIEGQIENVTEILMTLPKWKEGASEISFYTEESKRQFLYIEWENYAFEKASPHIFHSDSQGLWGYSYLCNSLQTQREYRPAVFVSYYYQFETSRLILVEVLETAEEIIDFACVLDYGDEILKASMHTEEGIRLLNPDAEICPCEEVLPIPELKGKDLERYIALVFLDIARDSRNLNKYKKILSDESFRLLQKMDCYYENPKAIYDFAVFGENGDITITSQFQPTLWGNNLIDIDIQFTYDMETGEVSVKEGLFRVSEKP